MKVISGCQTGADVGGLRAAHKLGIPTGGTMPKGWKTQAGPRPDWAEKYGLVESKSEKYPPRTRKNVKDSDVTVIFGNKNSSGSALTIKYCEEHGKPYYTFPYNGELMDTKRYVNELLDFLFENNPRVINVAGNREESNKGISDFTFKIMKYVLNYYAKFHSEGLDSVFEI